MSVSGARVTQKTLNARVGANLQRNLDALGRTQQRLSSGKQISRPSDSPAGTVSALRLRAEIRRNEQYGRNADDGIGWLGSADNTLTEGLDLVRKVRELALRGANASASATDRAAMAAEVTQLRQHALTLSNSSYLGQPLFAGTAGVTQAYDASGVYQGNVGSSARTVGAGLTVEVSLAGPAVFGPPGNDLFKVLADVEAHLTSSPGSLAADLDQIDTAFLRLQNSLSLIGARYHQVETLRDRADAGKLQATNSLAEVESIDLPATVMDLQLQEVAYQAALGAASRVLQPSLIDFLN